MAKAPPKNALFSMTGFARGAGRVSEGLGWTLTIKTVNHRFLDLHMRMPGGTEAIEMELRRLLKAQLVRGHVEATLTLERTAARESRFDAALVAGYVAAFREAAAQHGLPQEPDLNVILSRPEIFSSGNGGAAHDAEARAAELRELEVSVLAGASAVIAELKEMRAQEGQALAADLGATMARMAQHVAEVTVLQPAIERAHFERLRERLKTLLGESAETDPARLLQEAALLAERSDVAEEMARLRAHVVQFQASLAVGGESGKKLDFLLQEMNREANTFMSKMAGVGLSGVDGGGTKVTELGLRMKSDIEKAREQVQNIE